MEKTEQIYDKFLEEYVSEDAVRKYTTETAGLWDQLSCCATIMPKCISAARRFLLADLATAPSSLAGVRMWGRDEHHWLGFAS